MFGHPDSDFISTFHAQNICCNRVVSLTLSLALPFPLLSRDIWLLLRRSPDSTNEGRASLLVIGRPFGPNGRTAEDTWGQHRSLSFPLQWKIPSQELHSGPHQGKTKSVKLLLIFLLQRNSPFYVWFVPPLWTYFCLTSTFIWHYIPFSSYIIFSSIFYIGYPMIQWPFIACYVCCYPALVAFFYIMAVSLGRRLYIFWVIFHLRPPSVF